MNGMPAREEFMKMVQTNEQRQKTVTGKEKDLKASFKDVRDTVQRQQRSALEAHQVLWRRRYAAGRLHDDSLASERPPGQINRLYQNKRDRTALVARRQRPVE